MQTQRAYDLTDSDQRCESLPSLPDTRGSESRPGSMEIGGLLNTRRPSAETFMRHASNTNFMPDSRTSIYGYNQLTNTTTSAHQYNMNSQTSVYPQISAAPYQQFAQAHYRSNTSSSSPAEHAGRSPKLRSAISEKTFHCSHADCGKGFARRSDLARHGTNGGRLHRAKLTIHRTHSHGLQTTRMRRTRVWQEVCPKICFDCTHSSSHGREATCVQDLPKGKIYVAI